MLLTTNNKRALDINLEYDVTLSFAGENREFVREVAAKLKELDIKFFCDEYEQINLWGKDLYTHLDEIYRKKSKFCVMFISKSYKQKLWTNHERKSAQARAFKENSEYILPFRLDDTEIPGIKETVGYLSSENFSPVQLALAIAKKLGQPEEKNKQKPNGEDAKENMKMIEYGIFSNKDGKCEIRISKSEFFSNRLSKAFPGVRGLIWFGDPKTTNEGLTILLKEPLGFELFPGKKRNREEWLNRRKSFTNLVV